MFVSKMTTLRVSILTVLVVCGLPWGTQGVETSTNPPPCPGSCYCDLASRYVHCEGPLGLILGPLPHATLRLELRTIGTQLPRLPSGLLELSVRSSEVNTLLNSTLAALSDLTTLDMSHNNIGTIQIGSMEHLASLRHLDLGWNRLVEVRGTFRALSALETLNLSNNRIKALSSKTFIGLQRLQWLDVSRNRISQIEPGTFLPTPSLERVSLGHNPLASLRRLEFLGARLRYMDVSGMELKWAPESLGPSVRELRASSNSLETLRRGDLESYPSLSLLDLSDNKLRAVEDDALGRLEFLSRVWLSKNELQYVPRSLPRALKELYLDQNRIETLITVDLQGLPRLQKLSLRNNLLGTISAELLSLLPALRFLDLGQNLLKTATFGPNGLEELDISDNIDLKLKPTALANVPRLQVLRLANFSRSLGPDLKDLLTPLAELDTLVLSGSTTLAQQALRSEVWYGLTELDLTNNTLTTLPQQLCTEPGKLRVLRLALNPWNCSDIDLTSSLGTMRPHVADLENLKCGYPEELKGATLVVTNKSQEVTAPPSLAPTRVQIAPPTSTQPHATTNPESTAPLTINLEAQQLVPKSPSSNITSIPESTPAIKTEAPEINATLPLENTSVASTQSSSGVIIVNNTLKPENVINYNTAENQVDKPIKKPLKKPTNKVASLINNSLPKLTNKPLPPPVSINATTLIATISNINGNNTSAVAVTTTLTSINTNNTTTIPPAAHLTEPQSTSTTSVPPVDYEELAAVIEEEEFYPSGNFSELRAANPGSGWGVSGVTSNIPVGFLGVLGICAVGAATLGLLQWRQQRRRQEWQRLAYQPRAEEFPMEVLACNYDRPRW